MAIGTIQGVWEALISSMADEFAELAGYLLTRLKAPIEPGDVTLSVESTDRWPDSGSFIVEGHTGLYSGKTATTLFGVTAADGTVWDTRVRPNAPIMDTSRKFSTMDDLRASFITSEARGRELDILARNNGLERPRGLADDLFSRLLQVLIYLEAQTEYACEQVLDILYGPGNYELYEKVETDIHKVFVRIPFLASAGDTFQGKTYLNGGEVATAAANTVTVEFPVITPYGVYSAADPFREGTNYANASVGCTTAPGLPTTLSSAGSWLPSDAGKGLSVVLDGVQQWWSIESVGSANDLTLFWRDTVAGQVDSGGAADIVRLDGEQFAPWVVGHDFVITSGPNTGTYSIVEYITPSLVRISAVALVPDASFTWTLRPNFAASTGTALVPRATAVGNVITLPQTPPSAVLVDYTSVLSAQLVADAGINGEAQYPFYLWDETAIVQSVLDLITASGVIVVVEQQ